MASFYGNIKNNSRSSFIFDRIYSSRCEMEKALYETKDSNGAVSGDGVFINRYVLINYGYSAQGYYTIVPNKIVQIDAGTTGNSEKFGTYYREINGQEGYYPANYNLNTGAYDIVYNPNDTYYKKTNFVERFTTNLEEEPNYQKNREDDAEKYYASYDHTVWQKIYSDNKEKYILVAELNAEAPTFELITDAPGSMDGAPHFDLSLSSELNYVYHVPKNWNIILNQYNSEETYTNTTNTYWYYEQDLIDKDKTFNIKEDYPFINRKGFDISTRIIKPTINEGISLNETKSGTKYTIHQYRQINLTVDTYSKNRYFTLSKVPKNVPANHTYSIKNSYFIANTQNPTSYIVCPLKKKNATTYIPAIELSTGQRYYYIQNNTQAFTLVTDDYDANINNTHGYYELTTYKDNNDERIIQQDKDTKRLDIYLPSIGNAIAMMYDSIFGKPRYRERKIIGYTTIAKLEKYNQQDFTSYEIENSQYDLTQAQVNDLTIPVYFTADGKQAGYCSYSYFKNNFIETQTQGNYTILGKQYNGKNENIVYDKTSADVEIPVYELIDNILGYTSRDNLQIYQKDNENGNVKILTDTCLLSEDEINDLSPELVPGYFDVPVYAITNQNKRPYDEQKLFDTFSAPYDSLYDQDNVSMGWALDALKRYLSELRYLANGGNSQNGLGLQSDWTLDNDQAFGYIYHKPDIITAFIPTADNNIVLGKTYYKKTYDSEPSSINYGAENFELVDITPNDPAANNLYEIPATMLKNAETETYRPEDVVGYIDRVTYEVWNNSENGKISTSSTNYYIGNDESKTYYDLTDNDIAALQLYDDGKKTIAVKKVQVTFNNDVSNNPYFIYNGNRYVQAYQTVGQYLFEPITSTQLIMSCNCYFNNFQQIKVENNVITERKYYFINKMNIQDNVCLVSNGKRVNEFTITLSDSEQLNDEIEITYSDNIDTYQTQAIESLSRKDFIDYLKDQKNAITVPTSMTQSQFYEIQNGLSEEQFNNDKESYYIYDNTTQTFSQCNQSNSFNGAISYYKYIGITLPEEPTYEILSTYEENYIFNPRNNFEFDFAQYITRIEQKELDKNSWEKYRKNGTQYYLRSYKPIEQIDYEINTIWNSIKVND